MPTPATRLTLALVVSSLSIAPIAGCTAEPSAVIQAEQTTAPTVDPSAPLPSEMSLTIPAGLSDEELGAAFIDRLNAWSNAGANNKTLDEESLIASGNNISIGDFATEKVTGFTPFFTDALLVDGWGDGFHPDLVRLVEVRTTYAVYDLELNLRTTGTNSDDLEPWKYTINLEAVRNIAQDGTTRTLELDLFDSHNADQNRVGEAFGQDFVASTVGAYPYTFTVQFVSDGVVERLASLTTATRF